MFRELARELQGHSEANSNVELQRSASGVFGLHPALLAGALEFAWALRERAADRGPVEELGLPESVDLPQLPPALRDALGDAFKFSHHLIYAYWIENTRVVEIFQRVIFEYAHGEQLEVPSPEGQRWLRATESLFFRDAPSLLVSSLTSWIRPDLSAVRRNAYWRLFGRELDHGRSNGAAYPYEKPTLANEAFEPVFEQFAREVWRGIENAANIAGPDPTDEAAIANLARQLYDMLQVRRRHGNLAREEFFSVAMMSWFHLTLAFDSPIVRDLKAEASSPEQRLAKVGARVGLPSHPKSETYFRLAEPLSRLLLSIERGDLNDPATVPLLYARGSAIREDMMMIVTQWSLATERDLKAYGVRLSPGSTLGASTGSLRLGAPSATDGAERVAEWPVRT